MIILEGPDCCGKTTVGKLLRDHLPGWSYRWHTRPPKDVPCYAYHSWFIADCHPRIVVDRAHWSGYVYGRVYNDQSQLTPHQWRCEELALMSRNARVICMIDSSDNICNRWSERELYPPDKVGEIVDGYWSLLTDTGSYRSFLPNCAYCLPDLVHPSGQVTKLFEELLADEVDKARLAARLLPPSLGYGSTTPGFMIVGEAPGFNMEPKAPDDLPPSMPWDRGPSSDLLWEALDMIGLRWWQGYYTNISAFESPVQFALYWNLLGRPKTVLAVGAKASNVMFYARRCGLDIKHSPIHHPAYVRRFRSKEIPEWHDELRYALKEFCG